MKQQDWNKAREQRDKLLEHYNKEIKPTLLEFYKLTGENFNIKIDIDNDNNTRAIISFSEGKRIEYGIIEYDNSYTIPIGRHGVYSYIDIDGYNIQVPNIKVVRVFSEHWDKIVAYMDDRIKSMYNNLQD